MPNHLKALVAILGIAIAIIVVARAPLVAAGYEQQDYKRHWKIWLLLTMVVFFAHNFWIYILFAGLILLSAGLSDRQPLALYLVALFAAPHFTQLLAGFGPIQNLFYISHIRLLSLTVLLPLALILRKSLKGQTLPLRGPDIAVLGYIMVGVIAQALNESLTITLRTGFYLLMDIGLPYYVASRAVTSMQSFRTLAAALLFVTTIMGAVAIFETAKSWLLYETLREPLGIPLEYAAYITRSADGPLRALALTTYPIILGFVMMLGLGMYGLLADSLQPRKWGRLALAVLIGGLIATFSRGPWVGTLALMLLIVVMGPNKGRRLSATIGFGGFSLLALLASPFGQTVMDFLPFIGDIEAENITYRQQLLEVSLTVFWQNPLFGDIYFMSNPALEQMRQGQGIIDIVNTYLQVALPYGAVGLSFFLAALLLPVRAVWKSRKAVMHMDPDAEMLGRVLLACMLGIAVTIATASSIGVIAPLCWFMAGLCVSYARMLSGASANGKHLPAERNANQGM